MLIAMVIMIVNCYGDFDCESRVSDDDDCDGDDYVMVAYYGDYDCVI